MSFVSVPAYTNFRASRTLRAYNEAAFRYFLAVERRRAERSVRSALLFLVYRHKVSGAGGSLPAPLSASLFTAFGGCLREVDFVGWYREHSVVGALIILGASAADDQVRRIADRVTLGLSERLGGDMERLRVRVIKVGRRLTS